MIALAIFLAVLAVVFLVCWIRAERRDDKYEAALSTQYEMEHRLRMELLADMGIYGYHHVDDCKNYKAERDGYDTD